MHARFENDHRKLFTPYNNILTISDNSKTNKRVKEFNRFYNCY